MSKRWLEHYADTRGKVLEKPGVGIFFATNPGAPTNSVSGYAPGCIYLDHTNAALYVNAGTNTSSSWLPYAYGSPVVNVTAATLTLTQADNGKIFALNRAGGIAVTLPTAAAGLRFRFIVGTTFTGAATIKSATGADIMIGHATMGNNTDNTTVDWQATAASTYDTIDLFGTANSTGGIEGQEIEIIGLAANKWFVRIQGDAAGTEATPFADTVT